MSKYEKVMTAIKECFTGNKEACTQQVKLLERYEVHKIISSDEKIAFIPNKKES